MRVEHRFRGFKDPGAPKQVLFTGFRPRSRYYLSTWSPRESSPQVWGEVTSDQRLSVGLFRFGVCLQFQVRFGVFP